MQLPNDNYMLLSIINTKLRDFYTDLDDLCKSMNIEKAALQAKLSSINFKYNTKTNQFIQQGDKNEILTKQT